MYLKEFYYKEQSSHKPAGSLTGLRPVLTDLGFTSIKLYGIENFFFSILGRKFDGFCVNVKKASLFFPRNSRLLLHFISLSHLNMKIIVHLKFNLKSKARQLNSFTRCKLVFIVFKIQL
jgi:hypothetical protein